MMESPVPLNTVLTQQIYRGQSFMCLVVMACAESPEQSRPVTAPCCPPGHRSSTEEVSSLFQDKSAPEGTSNAIRSYSIRSFLETWLFSYRPCLVLNYKYKSLWPPHHLPENKWRHFLFHNSLRIKAPGCVL